MYLEKAYDTTSKYYILKDLHNINGRRGHLPNLIKNVPGKRNFDIILGSTISNNF